MKQIDLLQPAARLAVCGVDEAGRGPLAGPVYAAAVILDPAQPIAGLRDSKTLSARRREALETQIKAQARAWSVASASAMEIDQINILQASLLAMKRAVEGLSVQPDLALVDGNKAPRLACEVQTMVKGDALEPAISAASILAKCARDRRMAELATQYPQYGFSGHQGYPTAQHVAALNQHGPCPEHRRSFAPVRLAEALERPAIAAHAAPTASGSGLQADREPAEVLQASRATGGRR